MTRSIFVVWALAAPSIVHVQTNRPFTLDQVLEPAARQNQEVLVARRETLDASCMSRWQQPNSGSPQSRSN